jgi:hypothetical protein
LAILAAVWLLAGCGGYADEGQYEFYETHQEGQDQTAIAIVERSASARAAIAAQPGLSWSTKSDLSEANAQYPLFCPNEWDITYGDGQMGPRWGVDVASRKLRRYSYSLAEADRRAASTKTQDDFGNDRDRVILCMNGKAPVMLFRYISEPESRSD